MQLDNNSTKKIKVKCPNCGGTGVVAVGEYCSWCLGEGTIEVEKDRS